MPFSKWISNCEEISSPPPLLCLGLISQNVAALALQQPPQPLLPLSRTLQTTAFEWNTVFEFPYSKPATADTDLSLLGITLSTGHPLPNPLSDDINLYPVAQPTGTLCAEYTLHRAPSVLSHGHCYPAATATAIATGATLQPLRPLILHFLEGSCKPVIESFDRE